MMSLKRLLVAGFIFGFSLQAQQVSAMKCLNHDNHQAERWTENQKQILAEMKEKQQNIGYIASVLGKTEDQVKRFWYKYVNRFKQRAAEKEQTARAIAADKELAKDGIITGDDARSYYMSNLTHDSNWIVSFRDNNQLVPVDVQIKYLQTVFYSYFYDKDDMPMYDFCNARTNEEILSMMQEILKRELQDFIRINPIVEYQK